MIVAGQQPSFKKYTSDVINTHGLPYNYQSIMHYTRTAFSSNGLATVTPVAVHANVSDHKIYFVISDGRSL